MWLWRTEGGALLTIQVTAEVGSTVTAVEDYFLPGFELVAGRLVLSASQGGNTSDQDVDNLTVAMTPAAAAMPPLLFGDTVSGSVSRAGAVNRYAFTIPDTQIGRESWRERVCQ